METGCCAWIEHKQNKRSNPVSKSKRECAQCLFKVNNKDSQHPGCDSHVSNSFHLSHIVYYESKRPQKSECCSCPHSVVPYYPPPTCLLHRKPLNQRQTQQLSQPASATVSSKVGNQAKGKSLQGLTQGECCACENGTPCYMCTLVQGCIDRWYGHVSSRKTAIDVQFKGMRCMRCLFDLQQRKIFLYLVSRLL